MASLFSQNECFEKWEADSLLKTGNYIEAIKKYQSSNYIRENRDNLYRISICYCQLKNIDSAGYYFKMALRKGYYHPYTNLKLENDSALLCLKDHRDYNLFIISDSINQQNSFRNYNENLNRLFLERRERDQWVRSQSFVDSLRKENKLHEMSKIVFSTDSINMCFLDSIIDSHKQWTGYGLIGSNGDNAAWLIAQHADRFIDFQEKCYEYLLESYQNYNTNPNNVAYLYDRIMINKGLKQKYGTQMRIIDEKVEFINLEDFENVDKYRSCFILPPLSTYKEILEKRFVK